MGCDDSDVEVVDEEGDGGAGVGSADADVVHASGSADRYGPGAVDVVVSDPIVGVGCGGGSGLGEELVDDCWGAPVEGSVGSVVVVDADEGVEEGLELNDGGGLGLGSEPLFEGLLEAFHFPAGGWVVWSGVFLFDPRGGQLGFEVVAAASAASEAGGVDHGVVGEDRGRVAVCCSGSGEGVGNGVTGDGLVGGDRECVAGVVIEPGQDLGSVALMTLPGAEQVVGGVGLPGSFGRSASNRV